MRDERDLEVGLTTFRQYVRKRIGIGRPKSEGAKAPPPPGVIAEVDFGRMGMWPDPISGRRHVVPAFVTVLAFIRRIFVRPVLKRDEQAWVECHRRAFDFFGAVPHQILARQSQDRGTQGRHQRPAVHSHISRVW